VVGIGLVRYIVSIVAAFVFRIVAIVNKKVSRAPVRGDRPPGTDLLARGVR